MSRNCRSTWAARRIALLFAILVLSSATFGSLARADVELTERLWPSCGLLEARSILPTNCLVAPSVTPAQPVVFRLRARNRGVAAETGFAARVTLGSQREIASLDLTHPGNCAMHSTAGGELMWAVGPLAPSESLECDVVLAVRAGGVDGQGVFRVNRVDATGVAIVREYYYAPFSQRRDLALSIEPSPARVPRGILREFDVVLQNLGPDATTPPIQVTSSAFVLPSQAQSPNQRFAIGTFGDTDCVVFADGSAGFRWLTVSFAPIQASGSRRCTLQVSALSDAEGSFALEWLARPQGGPGRSDPELGNNRAVLQLDFGVAVVSGNGAWAMGMLAASILLLGLVALHPRVTLAIGRSRGSARL